MRASGYPSKAMYTMLIGAISNLILAPIFIFWLGWGIKGAAIATDIAMSISAAFVMAHFFNPKSQLRFHRQYFKLEWVVDPLKPKLPEMTMSPLFCARKG